MKQLLRILVGGQSLRHRPVALRGAEQRPVRAFAPSRGTERDVTPLIFPVSLSPLVLGLCRGTDDPPTRARQLLMRDDATHVLLGTLDLAPAGEVALPRGSVDLLRPTRSSIDCVSWLDRAWRYALAWRQVRANARRPHAFQMSFADLRALNVFYLMPRPVYLVSVAYGDASNLFPMDLVGPLGDDGFLLALRLTSPSIETMRAGGRFVVSGAPARLKETVYGLAAHHKKRAIDWAALPIPVAPSPVFGIPAPVDATDLRELELHHSEAIGSHMFFCTQRVSDSTLSDEPQLCHVSDMYARWRAERGRPFTDA